MSLKLHSRSLVSSREVVGLDHLLVNRTFTRKRYHIKVSPIAEVYFNFSGRLPEFCVKFSKSRRVKHLRPSASADDGVKVNGSHQPSTSSDVGDMRVKLDQSLQDQAYSDGLVQSLHDAARLIELGIKQRSSSSKFSWFSTVWLGVDRTAWVKELSYQASVYSLLQAAIEISSRGDGRDRDINIFVQRSLLRQLAPLESTIQDKFLAKQPEAYEWFWSEQIPVAVASFVYYFENDQHFAAATTLSVKGMSSVSGKSIDISLLMLALSCIAAITKLGATKVSCPQFFSNIPATLGRLMDMLVEFMSMHHAYCSMKDIGLHREFLVHFGPQAAASRVENDGGTEEIKFWVGLVQKQLQRALDRERIWSKLTTCESIEVLERDLAIFGFFVALGRSSRSYLSANGYDSLDEPIEAIIRYLIGGSALYYPQLSSISTYQLYVEVVCEELDWLPFYSGWSINSTGASGHTSKREDPPNAEAIPIVLDVCSHWIQSFIKYSKWLENPSSVKAAKFLTQGHSKLKKCMEELGIEITRSGAYSLAEKETDSFDKALESVEEALVKLEELLQELHMSSSTSRKEQLKAACSDLERIRRLKKEAEFLEASFRAKAASLQQGDEISRSASSINNQQQFVSSRDNRGINANIDKKSRNSRGLWSFLVRPPSRLSDPGSSADKSDDELVEQASSADSESNEILRFELLRNELIELERRVQKSAYMYDNEEVEIRTAGSSRLVPVHKKENMIEKSLDKLKETSTDVWQGTQLLAIDVAAALGLLRRVLIGDELTEKEKQALRRTLTDLASVVPIGILMLLPVTAVGHAAMLAAIRRYVPSLIPSTYGSERLDLLRQLEKVKEMKSEVSPTENVEE